MEGRSLKKIRAYIVVVVVVVIVIAFVVVVAVVVKYCYNERSRFIYTIIDI